MLNILTFQISVIIRMSTIRSTRRRVMSLTIDLTNLFFVFTSFHFCFETKKKRKERKRKEKKKESYFAV